MKIAIKNIAGKDQGELEVKFPLVEDGKGTQAVHDAVTAYRAAQRSGTACTKNVGEVAGTNKKPWRQKGTGRARAGSFRSPLWAGGGVVFGPRPRDFAKKISRKTRSLALRKALSRDYPDINKISLTDYRVRVLDSKDGTKARVRVIIESRDDKETWGTVGVSTDVIDASWEALVDSIEYRLV